MVLKIFIFMIYMIFDFKVKYDLKYENMTHL